MLGEHQAKTLQHQLDPAVGAQFAYADDFGAGCNDDGHYCDLFFSHKNQDSYGSLAVLA